MTLEELTVQRTDRTCKWITPPHAECHGNTQHSCGAEGRATNSPGEQRKLVQEGDGDAGFWS